VSREGSARQQQQTTVLATIDPHRTEKIRFKNRANAITSFSSP